MSLIVKNFKRFLRHEKQQKEEQEKYKEKASFTPICDLDGNKGHIKSTCPLVKKTNKNQKKSNKPQKKGKKAYMIWEDNDMESPYDEEEANIYLMENNQDDKISSYFLS